MPKSACNEAATSPAVEQLDPSAQLRRRLLHWFAAAGAAGCCPSIARSPAPSGARPPPAATASDDVAVRWSLAETLPIDSGLHSPHPSIAEVWQQLVDGAQRRIELCHFYVSERAPSRLTPVIDSLRRAAARGVAVRLLVDRKMAANYPDTITALNDDLNIRLLDAAGLMGGVLHAKYMLVDDRELFLGSANFDWRALEHIHELGIRVGSPVLTRGLRDVFERDWTAAAGRSTSPPAMKWPLPTVAMTDGVLRLVLSPQGHLPHRDAWDLPQLLAMLAAARMQASLQLLSLQPHFRDGRPFEALHQALRAALARGVDVRVLLSHWQMQAGRIDSLKQLVRAGVHIRLCTIPEHGDGFIPFARVNHAKYLVVDKRQSWIGTSNWDGDYFHHSRNVGLIGTGAALAAALNEVFTRMWRSRYSVDLDPARDYPEPRISGASDASEGPIIVSRRLTVL